MKVYEGGIPEHGFKTNLSEEGSFEGNVQPDCECDMASPKKEALGSCKPNGYTGEDVNPPAEGEVRIETRKESDNQPKQSFSLITSETGTYAS